MAAPGLSIITSHQNAPRRKKSGRAAFFWHSSLSLRCETFPRGSPEDLLYVSIHGKNCTAVDLCLQERLENEYLEKRSGVAMENVAQP